MYKKAFLTLMALRVSHVTDTRPTVKKVQSASQFDAKREPQVTICLRCRVCRGVSNVHPTKEDSSSSSFCANGRQTRGRSRKVIPKMNFFFYADRKRNTMNTLYTRVCPVKVNGD